MGLLLAALAALEARGLSSYAKAATDEIGSTGSAAVVLGVPDYRFVNDVGLGFAGNPDVFDVGEVATFTFPAPLRAIAGQHDLVISAWVGGLGATDNAEVQVEVSHDGTNFSVVQILHTEEARDRSQDIQENDHEGVQHFWIEFGGADNVDADEDGFETVTLDGSASSDSPPACRRTSGCSRARTAGPARFRVVQQSTRRPLLPVRSGRTCS